MHKSTGQQVIKIKEILDEAKGVSFVVVNFIDVVGKTVSHNVYWLSPDNDFTGFNSLDSSKVNVQLINSEKSASENKWTLKFTNNTEKVAFFVRPQFMKDDEEIMPSYLTANYFTLALHESTTVSVSAPLDKLKRSSPSVLVEGWDLQKQTISLMAK